MIKYKARTKNNRLRVKASISKHTELNISELDYLSNNFIRGVLRPERKNNHKVIYTGPVSISLQSYLLKQQMARYDFFLIVAQLLDIFRRIKNRNLDTRKIVFELAHIYINETTKELQFIYLPLTTVVGQVNIVSFLRDFVYQVSPAPETNNDYLSRFLFYLNSLPAADIETLEAYVRKEDRKAFESVKKQNVGTGGYKQKREGRSPVMEEKKTLEPFDDDEDTGLLEEEPTDLLSEETALLEADEGTTLVDEEETGLLNEAAVHYPTMRRVQTDEVISINKPVFRLGKERSYVDYFVANNNAVSRSHADIITRGSRYYIVDLNSKNKTYVNDQAIPVQYEIEIFNNDKIKLANEEFLFFV